MGNQHSQPDKEKEKKEEKPQDQSKPTSRHEKHRSRTITASPLPPTETKVNAEQTQNSIHPVPSESRLNLEAQKGGVNLTGPIQEKRPVKPTPVKEVIEDVKNMNLDLPPLKTAEEIRKEAEEVEQTPKFETMRAASSSSIVDEEELREADKSGLPQVPLVLDWNEGGQNVAVAGTFTGWRKRVKLRKMNGGFSTIIQVRPGTHRFHFLVDGEWRISNDFATAVDSEGNLLNYLEASEFQDDQDIEYSGSVPTWPEKVEEKEVWTREIPAYIARYQEHPRYNSHYSSPIADEDIVPPALPRQLEKPFLNQNHVQKDDQSVLPNPAHVVLNHLGVASAIKDNVLAVSSTNRYRQKYVTSILYKQVDED